VKKHWILLTAMVLLTGCSDDPVQPPPPTASVVVTDLASGHAVSGVKIVAMNKTGNTVLAGPRITDISGRIDFGIAPGPNVRYLVLAGLDWVVHSQEDWAATHTSTEIVLRRIPTGDGLPRIAGKVVDAITGEPLDQVFIGIAPQLLAYSGNTDPRTDVTGPDGTFLVQEIAFATHPVTGNLIQVNRLFVSRAGYRPRRWVYQHANGDHTVDITGAEIVLTALTDSDTGVLAGRILRNGLPVEAVPVGLGGFGQTKTGFGIPGQVTRTDINGRYCFTDLASGVYVVHPGFGLRDGYYFPDQERPPFFVVLADETTSAGDQAILWEIVPQSGDNATVSRDEGSVMFGWGPVPSAFEYVIIVNGAVIQHSTENHFNWEFPTDLPAGWYPWRVLAEDQNHNALGAMQKTSFWQLVD